MTKDDEILYVGQSKNIGKRLNDHFPPQNKGLSKICTFKEKWRKDRFFVNLGGKKVAYSWLKYLIINTLISIIKVADVRIF